MARLSEPTKVCEHAKSYTWYAYIGGCLLFGSVEGSDYHVVPGITMPPRNVMFHWSPCRRVVTWRPQGGESNRCARDVGRVRKQMDIFAVTYQVYEYQYYDDMALRCPFCLLYTW